MTVNEMIIEAITTDSRKRKCRWQTELEALGFKISKDRAWFIRYAKTDRFIELPYNENCLRTNNGYIKFGRVWNRKYAYINKPLSSIDLEGLLTKRPAKKCSSFNDWTDVDRIKCALHDRKRHAHNLETLMSNYQTQIDNLTKEYQRKIEEAKRSYDWNLNYHTKGLTEANERIENLLHKTA